MLHMDRSPIPFARWHPERILILTGSSSRRQTRRMRHVHRYRDTTYRIRAEVFGLHRLASSVPPKKLAVSSLDEKDRNPSFRRPMNNGTFYMPECYEWDQAWLGSIRGRSKPSAR